MAVDKQINNLMGLEPILIARLRTQLADIIPSANILTATDLVGVTQQTQISPAVHVVHHDYRVTESRTDGKTAHITQTWLVVVAARNMRDLKTGDAARVDAGLIAARVTRALMGFKADLYLPLRFVDGLSSGYQAGWQYLPLTFSTQFVLHSL
jgi:hypothetical protein